MRECEILLDNQNESQLLNRRRNLHNSPIIILSTKKNQQTSHCALDPMQFLMQPAPCEHHRSKQTQQKKTGAQIE